MFTLYYCTMLAQKHGSGSDSPQVPERRRGAKKLAGFALVLLAGASFYGLKTLLHRAPPSFPEPMHTVRRQGGLWMASSGAFSPDGRVLVSANADRTVALWNVQTSEILRVIRGYQQRVSMAAFSPNAKSLAVVSGRTLKLLDTRSGIVRWKLMRSHEFTGVAFSPNGKMLAVAVDNRVELRNPRTRALLRTITGVYSLSPIFTFFF